MPAKGDGRAGGSFALGALGAVPGDASIFVDFLVFVSVTRGRATGFGG